MSHIDTAPQPFAQPGRPLRRRAYSITMPRSRALPANDNPAGGRTTGLSPLVLNAALRHFARHGMAAAQEAARAAEAAGRQGDKVGHAWWREICRSFDRRLAARLDKADGAGA